MLIVNKHIYIYIYIYVWGSEEHGQEPTPGDSGGCH